MICKKLIFLCEKLSCELTTQHEKNPGQQLSVIFEQTFDLHRAWPQHHLSADACPMCAFVCADVHVNLFFQR